MYIYTMKVYNSRKDFALIHKFCNQLLATPSTHLSDVVTMNTGNSTQDFVVLTTRHANPCQAKTNPAYKKC